MSTRGVTLVVLIAACSSGAPARAASTTTAAAPTASPSPTPPAPARLDCTDPIATVRRPDAHYQIVGHALALVTVRSSRTYVPANPTAAPSSFTPQFAKTGLLVRTGTRSTVTVVSPDRGRATVEWGNTMRRRATTRLVVPRCPGPARWIAFPGGYRMRRPACVALDVRTGAHTHRVHVGVGTGCRGQHPPPGAPAR